ncbi:early endosome antigen 1 isoform X1 [Salmo salar]|uniref:Early endosome antigen 1-like isoform X1 n=1 Tax=Salmo salar TaxID=8030 RepID=A0A1S3MX40_SALSA|nr:early endosome antigen 1 isoform X1 [Salmo salar]XP_014007749.1 early endosome antigen 1 isoform X1 [Salmo salar]|eukprot:XP_014007747.1 PREDICTED: early endosome antigen 1-like isoform X1 [Salmo salar]
MDRSKNSVAKRRNRNATKGKKVTHKSNVSPAISRLIQDTSNHIPLGRQLQRTPPTSELKITWPLSFETQTIETTPGQEPLSPALNMTMDLNTIEPAETETCRRSRITSSTLCSGSVLEEDPYSLIRDMQGYEVTPADLVFLKRARQERQINALQRELDELLRQQRNQMLARNLSLASREKIQTDLDEVLSCEQTVQMGQVFLSRKLSSTEVEALDSKSLLAQIKTADVQQAVEEEQAEITELEDRVARALELRERGEQRQQEIENRNRAILTKKAKIKHLMKELSELKSQLAGAEESLLTIQGKMDTLKDTEKEEDTGPQEALQVAPSQAKAPKAPRTKRNGGETITQQVSHVRIKAENTPTIVGESHMASILRRSTRIATKKSCVENKPVLRKTRPVKASISL